MKRLCLVVTVLATSLALPVAAATAASASVSSVSLVQDKPDKAKDKPDNPNKPDKPKKDKKPKKPKPPAAGGHGKENAPGQLKKQAGGADEAPTADNGNGPSPASRNENKKITFCHVPPGNPSNGHLITTSVNAIQPGHVNHPGDIIPPFSFVKQGKTVSFPGQNWDAEGRATLANGCKAVPAVAPTDPPKTSTDETTETTGAVLGTSMTGQDQEDGEHGILDAVLPNTGGARLGLLAAGLALVAAGVTVLVRRRRTLT